MSNVNKNGNISSTNFINNYKDMNLFYLNIPSDANQKSITLTASSGTNSSRSFNQYETGYFHVNQLLTKYRVKLKVEWNGFDNSNTNGTFRLIFQGVVKYKDDNVWSWNGKNLMTVALNAHQSLASLVLSEHSGVYFYDVIFDMSDSNIDGLGLGIRSDYSNGKGTISVSEVEIYSVDENNNFVKITNNYILSNDILEF